MQMPKCSLLTCQGQQRSKDELIQEKMASAYASNMKRSHHQFANQEQIVHHPKSVFSFRLNCSRNYDQSDKNKRIFTQNYSRDVRSMQGIQSFTSVQRLPLKNIQQKETIQSFKRYYVSPQTYKPIQNIISVPKDIQICPQMVYKNEMQQFNQPCLKLTDCKADMNRKKDLAVNVSIETSHSSISSLQKLTKDKENQPKSHESFKVFQPVQHQKQNLQQNSLLKNSSFGLRSNEQINALIIDTSFEKLQNIQHRNYFENANTINSILTSNQLKDRSLFHSFKDCNTHSEIFQDQQISVEYIDRLNAQKMDQFSRNKKKTAYFGCIQNSTDRQRTIINDFKEADEDIIDQKQIFQINQKRKVKFSADFNVYEENPPQTKKIIFHQQVNNRKKKYQPSLHNIIQSTQIEHKLSIQNSIKQMPLMSPDVLQDNGGRFKYVNTIKSIGGQSSISQTSYIDIKFMQNLNYRKAVMKLV